MSYLLFKNNMNSFMNNQVGVTNSTDFAKKLTSEYDSLIRRGQETINQVSVDKTNTSLMELSLTAMLSIASLSKIPVDINNQIGKAMILYWLGATMQKYPIPIIPALGSFKNISIENGLVLKPGEFPESDTQQPITDVDIFLDILIELIKTHLSDISGIYNTKSLYPGFPLVPPAPGVVIWKGYQILEPDDDNDKLDL